MKPCYCVVIFLHLVALATIAFEVWAKLTGHETISAWVWATEEKFPVLRWIALAAIAFLAYHLFLSDLFRGADS